MSDDDIAERWYRLRQLIRIFRVLVVNKAAEEEDYAETYAGSVAPFVRRRGLLLLFRRLWRLARVRSHFRYYCSQDIAEEVNHLLIARRSIQRLIKRTFTSIERAVKDSASRKKIRAFVAKHLAERQRRFIGILKSSFLQKYAIYYKKMSGSAYYQSLMRSCLSRLRHQASERSSAAQSSVFAMSFNAQRLQANALVRLKRGIAGKHIAVSSTTKARYMFLENTFIRLCFEISKSRLRRRAPRGSDDVVIVNKCFRKLRCYRRRSRGVPAMYGALQLLKKRHAMLKLVQLLKTKYIDSIRITKIAKYVKTAYRFRKLSIAFSAYRDYVDFNAFDRNIVAKKGNEFYSQKIKFEYFKVRWAQRFMRRRSKRLNARVMSKFLYEKTAVGKSIVQINNFINHIVIRNRELMVKSIYFWKIFKSISSFKMFRENVIRKQKKRAEKIIDKLQKMSDISATSAVGYMSSPTERYESKVYDTEKTFGAMLWKHGINSANNENSNNSILKNQIDILQGYAESLSAGSIATGAVGTGVDFGSCMQYSSTQHLLRAQPIMECPDNIQLPPALSLNGSSSSGRNESSERKVIAMEIINFVKFELANLSLNKG